MNIYDRQTNNNNKYDNLDPGPGYTSWNGKYLCYTYLVALEGFTLCSNPNDNRWSETITSSKQMANVCVWNADPKEMENSNNKEEKWKKRKGNKNLKEYNKNKERKKKEKKRKKWITKEKSNIAELMKTFWTEKKKKRKS